MKKSELVKIVMDETKMKKKDAQEAVNVIFGNISGALSRGEAVRLYGFGNFEVRNRQSRLGRNPQTGERIQIPGGRTPAFKPSRPLRNAVND